MGQKQGCNVNAPSVFRSAAILLFLAFLLSKVAVLGSEKLDLLRSDSSLTNIHLTLEPAASQESYGPLFYKRRTDISSTWAIPPLISHAWDETTDFDEWDFLYPVVTVDRFGGEYRFQIFQVFAF